MDIITKPFGQLLKFLYDLCGENYGLSIVVFTILVNLILAVFTYKQQKSMLAMQKIQPKLNEIQKKYKDDKEKLSNEMMKLYKDNDVSPMSGCLPMLIQFPVIMGLYWVVTKPLTYMFGVGADKITKLAELLSLKAQRSNVMELEIAQRLTPDILKEAGVTSIADKIDFNFLGLNFGEIAQNHQFTELIWIVPLLCAITTFAATKISTMLTKAPGTEENPAASSMKTMMYIMPVMTGYFASIVPGSVGLYWIVGNIVRTGIQVIVTKAVRKQDGHEDAQKITSKPNYKNKKKKKK